jgi:hypothetical protein
VFLLVELALLDELAQALPAALQAVLLLVQLALLDELVNAASALAAGLDVPAQGSDRAAVGAIVWAVVPGRGVGRGRRLLRDWHLRRAGHAGSVHGGLPCLIRSDEFQFLILRHGLSFSQWTWCSTTAPERRLLSADNGPKY